MTITQRIERHNKAIELLEMMQYVQKRIDNRKESIETFKRMELSEKLIHLYERAIQLLEYRGKQLVEKYNKLAVDSTKDVQIFVKGKEVSQQEYNLILCN